jgi:subtilisin family serine protease
MRIPMLTTLVAGTLLVLHGSEANPAGPMSGSARTSRVIVKVRGTGAKVSAESLFSRHGLRTARPLHAARPDRRLAARSVRAPRDARVPDLGGTYVVEVATPPLVDGVLAALRADPQVAYAHEDKLVPIAYVPNDPSYSSSGSWGQAYDDLWGLKKLGTPSAWDVARGEGVVVAVVDTGVDYTHPDIDDNVWSNAGEVAGNGVDDDGNGFVDDHRGWDFVGATWRQPIEDNDPQDVHGHGTHVAGIAAAEGDNGIGVVGVAWKARVMALKGIADDGFGPESKLARAIVYATDNGADIINASFGSEGLDATLGEAVAYAHAHGVVFVAAAGNDGRNTSSFYPAGFPGAIAVAALDPADQKASFSNYGTRIDVTAPGWDILSLRRANGGYVRFFGTSMAAPHVSGLAALVVERHPEFTNEQIRQVLRASAVDLGAAGADILHGHGRVSAENAVQVNEALEVRLQSPADGIEVQGPVTLRGTAQGPGFERFFLEVGTGEAPTAWTVLRESVTPVTGADVGVFDPSLRADGVYTLRLRALGGGATFTDRLKLRVRHIALSSPAMSASASIVHTAKPGSVIEVHGRATGAGFLSYRLEWAPGRNATTGWSTSGITLTGGGTAQVEDGMLGGWATGTTLQGEYTLRLVVTYAALTRAVTAAVYLERDLVSRFWPAFIPNGQRSQGPIPARTAEGGTHFILCTGGSGARCTSVAADGSQYHSTPLIQGGVYAPSAGDLDPAPGDEVVVPDGPVIRILSARLETIRVISAPPPDVFGFALTSLADLDGDGTREILAISTTTFRDWTLHVYRADGSLYSSRYPLRILSPLTPGREQMLSAVAADLDGDRRPEIVVAVLNGDATQYTLLAYDAEGLPRPSWPTSSFSGGFSPLIAADLDRDGRAEIVIAEQHVGGGHLRVVNSDGATRPGWPRQSFGGVFAGFTAVGDLDVDGRDEIVAATHTGYSILRDDGSEYASLTGPLAAAPGPPVLADVDNDAHPDLVASHFTFIPEGDAGYHDVRLRAFGRTGALIREWPLFGAEGRAVVGAGLPALGDFTGDGRTDIAVHTGLLEVGGANDGKSLHTVLTVLTAGTPFDPARADWPLQYRDPQNSRSRGAAAETSVRVAPAADAHVRDGGYAGTNFGAAAALEVKATGTTGNRRVAYLRFPLASIGTDVTSARLRLYGRRSMASAATDSAFAVSSNTWSETGLTWNNRPALGTRQGAGVSVSTTADYHDWDVTAFVRAQKSAGASSVSLAVQMDTAVDHAPDTFHSKEAAANRPELLVDMSPEPPLRGHYRIMARHSGKAVVVQSASTANGANVFQWTYGGSSSNDEWLFTPIDRGYHRITARHSGKAMAVQAASTANGGDVVQYSYTSTSPANDEWRVEAVGSGFHRFVNRHSGKVLNVAGGGTANGTNVDQSSWANMSQQQFQIVAIP